MSTRCYRLFAGTAADRPVSRTPKDLFDGILYKVDIITERIQNAGLDNVELALYLSEVPDETVDVAIAVRNYHDIEWVFPDLKRADRPLRPQVPETGELAPPRGRSGAAGCPWHKLLESGGIDPYT